MLISANQDLPSPTVHRGPIHPGGHIHSPLTGSQEAPLSQLQKNSQLGPYLPDLHAETEVSLMK